MGMAADARELVRVGGRPGIDVVGADVGAAPPDPAHTAQHHYRQRFLIAVGFLPELKIENF